MICCRFRRLDFGKTILAGICPYFVVNLHPFAEPVTIKEKVIEEFIVFSLLYLTKTTSYQLMIWKR